MTKPHKSRHSTKAEIAKALEDLRSREPLVTERLPASFMPPFGRRTPPPLNDELLGLRPSSIIFDEASTFSPSDWEALCKAPPLPGTVIRLDGDPYGEVTERSRRRLVR
jgi:hypothetical protein